MWFKENFNFKKILRIIRNIFTLLLVVFLFYIAIWEIKYLIFETSYFELKKITIEGNQTITKEEILSLAGFKLSENFFKLNYNEAKRKIMSLPKIKSVDIITEGLGEVLIKIVEREAILLVLYNKYFYEIDAEGIILNITNQNIRIDLPILNQVELPNVKCGESVLSNLKIKFVLNWLLSVPIKYLTNISEICLDGNELVLITNSGIRIFPGSSLNFINNFELLMIVLNKFQKDGINISYLDMRFNNEIIVKPVN